MVNSAQRAVNGDRTACESRKGCSNKKELKFDDAVMCLWVAKNSDGSVRAERRDRSLKNRWKDSWNAYEQQTLTKTSLRDTGWNAA